LSSLYDLLTLDLAKLTDKNHHIAAMYVAIIDKVIEHCEKHHINIEKVSFGVPVIDGDKVTLEVKYAR
jgi:archaellum component FlaC